MEVDHENASAGFLRPERPAEFHLANLGGTWPNLGQVCSCAGNATAGSTRLWQIRAWPAPPNWSRADWLEEIEQIAWIASWQAEREFDPARGKERGAFVYGRVMASALAAYRKEWLWKIRRRCSGSGRTA